MSRTNLARIRRVELYRWEGMKRRCDAMTTNELKALIDEHYGEGAALWVEAYLGGLPAAELAALDGPPDPHNAAQQRFNKAYACWAGGAPWERQEDA